MIKRKDKEVLKECKEGKGEQNRRKIKNIKNIRKGIEDKYEDNANRRENYKRKRGLKKILRKKTGIEQEKKSRKCESKEEQTQTSGKMTKNNLQDSSRGKYGKKQPQRDTKGSLKE